MGVLRVRFSEEEKEELKQAILDEISTGDNDMQIASKLRIISKDY